ncbi:MAG: hypothetical protein GY762_13275 [Proteobacteria bacterium]|nr:hypothetical protein [Pseudomonadota bacterium]
MKKRALFIFSISLFLGCAVTITTACDEDKTKESANVGCCAFDELYGFPFMSSYNTDAELSSEVERCLAGVGETIGTWTDAECTPPVGTGGCRKASLMPDSTLTEGVTHWTPGHDVYAFGTCAEENQITYGEDDTGGSTGPAFETEYINEDAIYNIAIISHITVFKKNLIQLLIDEYKDQASIYFFEIANMTDVMADNYDVILIMDWCDGDLPSLSDYASAESDPLATYIDDMSNPNSAILVVTTGPENNYTCGNDTTVDAITSASSVDETSSVFSDITAQIDPIIPAE